MANRFSLIRPFGRWPLLWDDDDPDSVFSLSSLGAAARDNKMNVEETKEQYKVTVDIPGFDKNEVKVTFEDGTLMVSGSKSEEKKVEDKKKNYIQMEKSSMQFTRQWMPPVSVDEKSIKANVANGELKITLDKKGETSKGVEIKVE